MSNYRHTPGPWIIATLPTSVGICHKIGPFPAAGDRPYTYACVYGDGIRKDIDDETPGAIELAANARLMAASPDMLAALQEVLKAHGIQSGLQALCAAAVAKATGRSIEDVITGA